MHRVISHRALKADEMEGARYYFENDVLPLLSPQIIDVHHPFPHLANKALYCHGAAEIEEQEALRACSECLQSVDRCYFLKKDHRRMMLVGRSDHCVISIELFVGYEIEFHTVISVTRNAGYQSECGGN